MMMWSPFPYMLTLSILGLSVLQACAYPSTAPFGLSQTAQTSSTNLGQCYAYFDDQFYHISTSLQPCENVCPGAKTYQCVPPLNGTLYNLPGLNKVHTDPVHNGALFEIGHCVCNYATKTVLPDLTSIGYTLTKQQDPTKDGFEVWEIRYAGSPQWIIDTLGYPFAVSESNAIYIETAYNKRDPADSNHPGDLNPRKIPLRDIMLSFWQSKTKRTVKNLFIFKYFAVQEESMVAAVPEAYKAMGKTLDNQEEVAGGLVVTRTGKKKGEHNAYGILSKTAFAYGLRRLSEEYEEFNKKVIHSFNVKWEYGIMELDIELRIP